MTNQKETRGTRAVIRSTALLPELEELAQRIPALAAFLEVSEGEPVRLTEEQQEFLDRFSSQLTRELSGELDTESVTGDADHETT